jgi:PAS domain-containing protein
MDKHLSAEPVGGRLEDLTDEPVQPLTAEAEQRYRWLLDHSPLAICVHVDGRHVYVNEAAVRRMRAQSADQLLGRPITDFVHPDSLCGALRLKRRARQFCCDRA